ncbi:uncharacterized protein LOC135704249 [Ochlerotatus camptorhynchus]|uniref:uncharacterized protein LOC135704249 n=1 Tax=Ochlerotatus camptorhynchus TaxID=644619 RepID=UPI0031D60EFA
MDLNEESIKQAATENMETEDTHKEDDLLQSVSMDNVGSGGSVSSSILNSEDEDDGVNVTIKEIRNEQQQSESRPVLKPKLSGAKKKRFKKLLLSGHGREEALSMVLLPPNVSTPKRPRNINSSNNSDGKPIPKKQKGQVHTSVNKRMENIRQEQSVGQNPTYSDVAKWVRVGIMPKNYPQIQLTMEQMYVVQEAILQKVTQQRRESFKPKFINCWQRTGHLVINCQDTETADWLDSVVPMLTPWEGVELTVIDADDIPRLDVMIGFFPQSVNDDNDTIRVFIESQNDGLSTNKWRIIQRNTLYEKHVEWFFTVDEASMQHFKACNFLINFKFGQTTLRKKGMYKPDSEGMVDSSDDLKGKKPESCQNSGNKDDLSVPGTSGTDGNLPGVMSSKTNQNPDQNLQENSKDLNHSGHPMDRNPCGPPNDQIISGPPKDQNLSGPSKDWIFSGSLKDRNISGHAKGRNDSRPPQNRKSSGLSKDRNYSESLKDRNISGHPKGRDSSGPLQDRKFSGSSKNQKQ